MLLYLHTRKEQEEGEPSLQKRQNLTYEHADTPIMNIIKDANIHCSVKSLSTNFSASKLCTSVHRSIPVPSSLDVCFINLKEWTLNYNQFLIKK